MKLLKHLKTVALAVAVAIVALPAVAEPAKSGKQNRSEREIQICVAEISKRVKYGTATRVVHKVREEQKNIAEQLFRINTTIYAGSNDTAIGNYSSLCVTRGPIELVSLRIDGTH